MKQENWENAVSWKPNKENTLRTQKQPAVFNAAKRSSQEVLVELGKVILSGVIGTKSI